MEQKEEGLLTFAQANTVETVFLERGHRVTLPCPLVKSRQIPPENVDAMYWYYGSISDTSLLISYFFGSVAPQNGIPEGVYNIDDEFNLIIENITASNEGNYYCNVKPHLKIMAAGSIEVCDKVSPRRPHPAVIDCNPDIFDAEKCEVPCDSTPPAHNLTCVMKQVKPAVELRWIRLFLGGQTELNASTTVKPVVLPAKTGSWLRNNTYSTSASIQVEAVDDEEVYECEALGVAVGGSTRTRVRLTKTRPTTYDTTATYDTPTTYDEVQPSNNPETTLVLADEVPPTASKPVESRVSLIVPVVLLTINSIILAVIIFVLIMKRNKDHRAMKMLPYTSVATSSNGQKEESNV
ncbi:uncharacterized protein LOC119736760 [Patiria miniata]|uniref:Ig-like domain-containing protein n=1 Tax=Patiria miniata TaxID=46514 RepID=A0A914AT93_PATMI|nr:uncharacterized protein LOC119736760 [Patiria miniata]